MPRADVHPDVVDEAAHCRRLANGAVPYEIALELERLADEYEGHEGAPAPAPGRLSPPAVSRVMLATLFRGHAVNVATPGATTKTPSTGAADFVRDLARFFLAASKNGTDPRARRYCAERAVELAQEAERISRQPVALTGPDHG